MSIAPCSFQLSVPSTTANLGPGFDCLGLALSQRNLWQVQVHRGPEPGRCRVVESLGGGALETIPTDEKNLFFSSWKTLHERNFGPDLLSMLAEAGYEVSVKVQNETPISRGLGSSAAVRVASSETYRRLTGSLGRPAWELAAQLEGHPDNAGPAGLGGLFLGTRDSSGRFRALSLEIHSCWKLVVAIPDFSLHTERARAVLPKDLSREDAIFNMGHLPFLLEGLKTGDGELLSLGCQDKLHQNQRASLIPGFHDVLQGALSAGASAAFLSGAGPTMAAFVDDRKGLSVLDKIVTGMGTAFARHGVAAEVDVKSVEVAGLLVSELAQGVTLNQEAVSEK